MDVDRRRRSVAGDALTVSGSAKVPRRRSRGPERGRAGVVARETSRGGGSAMLQRCLGEEVGEVAGRLML